MPIIGGGSSVRAGTVQAWPSNTIPAGWIKCNGAAVSRTLYAALFNEIGTTYGAGDGSMTFNVPDMRGEFLRGLDDGRGVDTGRALGTDQPDALQGHQHTLQLLGGTGSLYGFGGTTGNAVITDPNGYGAKNPKTDGVNGTPRTSAETRPRNRAMHYIIKF